jgi:hypothetical protein
MSNTARRRNEQLAAKALSDKIGSRMPFLCECGDPDCLEFVLLHPRDYEPARKTAGGSVTLRGHRTPLDADTSAA